MPHAASSSNGEIELRFDADVTRTGMLAEPSSRHYFGFDNDLGSRNAQTGGRSINHEKTTRRGFTTSSSLELAHSLPPAGSFFPRPR